MKFSERYPDAKVYERVAPMVLVEEISRPCYQCKEETSFFDYYFHRFLCSEECLLVEINRLKGEAHRTSMYLIRAADWNNVTNPDRLAADIVDALSRIVHRKGGNV